MKSSIKIASFLILLSGCGSTENPSKHFGDSTACYYDGQTYSIGSTFRSSDNCNTCSCSEQGVACTLMGCAP